MCATLKRKSKEECNRPRCYQEQNGQGVPSKDSSEEKPSIHKENTEFDQAIGERHQQVTCPIHLVVPSENGQIRRRSLFQTYFRDLSLALNISSLARHRVYRCVTSKYADSHPLFGRRKLSIFPYLLDFKLHLPTMRRAAKNQVKIYVVAMSKSCYSCAHGGVKRLSDK